MFRKCRLTLSAIIILGLLSTAIAGATPDPKRFDLFLKTSWYGVYLQGAKVGYMKTALEKVDKPIEGWRMISSLVFGVSVAGDSTGLTIEDSKIFRSPGGELISSSLKMPSPNGNIEVSGRVDGESFMISSDIAGQIEVKAHQNPLDYLDSLLCLEMNLVSGTVKVGDSLNYKFFEASPPITGIIHSQAKIIGQEENLFNGVSTPTFVVDITIQELNLTTRSKIDRYGNLLEGTFGGAMTVKLENETLARQLDMTFDMLADNIVHVEKEIDSFLDLKAIRFRLTGINEAGILECENQKINPESSGAIQVEISRQMAPVKPLQLPIESAELDPFLLSEPQYQSDHPRIRELARQILGDETDSWAAAKKVNRWVFENIEKRFTADFSNALQTLNSGRGDCGEHAALAVALMRAAGIPARPVVGLIYWPPGKGFGYHAWIEVYVGQWIQMDPSWGEDLANPARIAVARGDIIAQVSALLGIMGKIEIEVVQAEYVK